MNFLTFILSLLLILSFGASAMLKKQSENQKILSTFLGHLKVNRKILSRTERATYREFHAIAKPPSPKKETSKSAHVKTEPKMPPINPPCARLNLWPLLDEGKEKHRLLYDTAATLLKTFYGSALFEGKAHFEYRFLDLFLKKTKESLQKKSLFALEKVSFNDPVFQEIYYKMLKGTKEKALEMGVGYPSLLDSISVDKVPSKICLCHAHPDQIAVFFGFKAAGKMFLELHQEKPPPLTCEMIDRICAEFHVIVDREIFEWFEFGRPRHERLEKETMVAEDETSHISLRKNIYTARG